MNTILLRSRKGVRYPVKFKERWLQDSPLQNSFVFTTRKRLT